MHGLSDRQKDLVRAELARIGRYGEAHRLAGWTIHRSPTTIHPPVAVELRYRDWSGALRRRIPIG
jgi:hypothetical protein